MTRTVFSTLTADAAKHLSGVKAELADLRRTGADQADGRDELMTLVSHHSDLTAALVHLGRTISDGRQRSDGSLDRLLRELEKLAVARTWTGQNPEPGSATSELRQASRCIRAAADLWATHRTAAGALRSPEASRLRHPSMIGAAMRHWQSLVGQSATLADELSMLGRGLEDKSISDLTRYPRPSRNIGILTPVPLPVARPSIRTSRDVLDAIDDRVDRIHRHVWATAQDERMSAPVLVNVAAIGMLLARVAGEAQRRDAGAVARLEKVCAGSPEGVSSPDLVTLGELERWAVVAAALAPLRTPDPPTTVLQVERLDLARLLDRALATRRPRPAPPDTSATSTSDRLTRASLQYRSVAAPCANGIRSLQRQGHLYLAGRQLPPSLRGRRHTVAAQLNGHLVPVPTALARRIEAQLQAISADPSGAGSAA